MTEQCPSDEALAAFADGNVWPDDRPRIEGHLSRCPKCREIVVFAVRMKESIPDSPSPDPSLN
jgi:anti-sigma factor RsiW